MPSGKLHKLTNGWQLVIHTGRKTEKGYERIRRMAQGKTRRDAQLELDRELYRLNRAAATGGAIDNRYPLDMLLADWSREIELTVAEDKTRREYIRHATRAIHALQANGIQAVDEIDRRAMLSMLERITRQGLSHNTANKALAKLGTLLKYGVSAGVISHAPELPKALPEKRVKYRRAYTCDEVSALLEQATDTWRPTFHFLVSTGLRIDEYRHVRWSDLDLQAKSVSVKARPGWKPKTASGERTIPLSDAVCKTLSKLEKHSDYVFATRDGKRRVNNVRRHHAATVRRALRKLYPDWTAERIDDETGMLDLHALRYTFCTELIKAGTDIKTVQRLMGHSDVQTTLNIYAQYCTESAGNAVQKLPW